MLFDELRAIQHSYGYLPTEQLSRLSKDSGIPLYQINGVAEFYPEFRTVPAPQVCVEVCTDMACRLHGAEPLLAGLEQRFGRLGKKAVELHRRSCLGQCDAAPALTLNEKLHRRVTQEDAETRIQGLLAQIEVPVHPEDLPSPALRSDPYRGQEKYQALKQVIASRDFDGVLATLKEAGLGGMGGAGFPTNIKWQVVKDAPGTEKYVVVNADESEPGTIKDRFILTHLPNLVIEGAIIGALVTGAQKGFIYLRHEYKEQETILRAELAACYQAGLLGPDLLGSGLSFELELFLSPGGYICGEGSAQLEAIEGKRAEPRNKPPNSATHGLWMKPTALNNVETFAIVPQILHNGVEWFKTQGVGGAAGLKFIGLSGDIVNPGAYEIPMGLPVREAIEGIGGGCPGGKKIKAFTPSGAASGYIPYEKFKDVSLDFKSMRAAGTMLGSGAFVVLSEDRCILDMALNAVTFFRNESCGKCVPCRMGSQKMVDVLLGWTRGRGTPEDFALVADLAETMEQTSICGLGQFVPYPIMTALRHFREEIEEHVVNRRCPTGVCPMQVQA